MTLDEALTNYESAREAVRTAESFERAARWKLVSALAEAGGLTIGDKITVGRHRAFVDRIGMTGGFLPNDGECPYVLSVTYRKAKKDGTPYANAQPYPTVHFEKGWDE